MVVFTKIEVLEFGFPIKYFLLKFTNKVKNPTTVFTSFRYDPYHSTYIGIRNKEDGTMKLYEIEQMTVGAKVKPPGNIPTFLHQKTFFSYFYTSLQFKKEPFSH